MTFEGDNFGRDNPDGDGFDRDGVGSDYDTAIAERFALFDQLQVPEYGTRADALPAVATLPAPKHRFDPSYALAIAAAFVVIAAASYFALRPTTDLGLDATDDGSVTNQTTDDRSNQSAAVQDGDTGGDKLTVEVAPSSTASSQAEASPAAEEPSADEGDEANATEEATTTTAAAGAPAESDTTVASDGSASTATTTSVTIDKDSVLNPPVTKPVGPAVTIPDVPQTTFAADGPVTQTVRGTLTEVFTDCAAHYVLGSDGNVEQLEAISCDGGSYVVVDGKTIRTSAGNSPAGQYYDRHNPALRPGQQVVVSATAASQASAALTLNCAQCGITLGG